jgi:hypothetical protein
MRIEARWRLLLTGTPLQNNLQELVVRKLAYYSIYALISYTYLVSDELYSPRILQNFDRLAESNLQSES